MNGFVHLHVHSEYSLLDGASKVEDLAIAAKELGQSALALTDHGVMYGVVDFYKACKKHGVKPIIGMEAYVAPRELTDKQGKADKEFAHLILLAKNKTGYQNLTKLSSLGFIKGFYYKPRIDYSTLESHREGLIVMTACLSGDVPRFLMANEYDEAFSLCKRLKQSFGDDFYLEVQDHGIRQEKEILSDMIKLAKSLSIKLVCTNDVHYVKKEDSAAQDALMCIQTGRFLDEENRMKMDFPEFHLKSEDEMRTIFGAYPQMLSNTLEVAEKCNLDFEFGKIYLPNYDVPNDENHFQYLTKLCLKGIEKRKLADNIEYQNRLEFELNTIQNMGYIDYFLIVWDFIRYAKQERIEVGPGRGSAAGSLVAYCLEITDIDPIKYGLIFERFLNPQRISMPDIDIDFCCERRQEVIDYVTQKYGSHRVAQIITFGTMAARSSIRDVGRVMRVPYGNVDKLAKLIPMEIGMTIKKALSQNKELQEIYENNDDEKTLIDLALKVEGLTRHASTHAAGVVISAQPLVEHVPLQKNDEAITTQFPMGTIEELGLLKMDFLGLRTLTVIRDAIVQIKQVNNIDIDFETISLEDKASYDLISSGETDGLFQLESQGMRAFLQNFKPDKFEDIIAGISLYRPGPMDQIPMYVERKFHPEKVKYDHPMLEPILNMTYGCMVYQEQVMQIFRDLAGYSFGQSDLVRRAMSKKKKDVLEREKEGFVLGCSKNNISKKIAEKIFDQMMDFAQYAFNKSHAAAYAVIAYRTAWLRAHFPSEFICALINSFLNTTEKIAEYVYCARQNKIALLPPDINNSFAKFQVEKNTKAIRFGLAAIKNVGKGACDSIVFERETNGKFLDFNDFLERCATFLTKRLVENLIKTGAFDSFGQKRSVLDQIYIKAIEGIVQEKKRNIQGQISLFDFGEAAMQSVFKVDYPDLPEFNEKQKLIFEKEATGLFISGHPLSEFSEKLKTLASSRQIIDAEKGGEFSDKQNITSGGIVNSVKVKLTRANQQMAYISIEDEVSQFEGIAFPRTFEKYRNLLQNDELIVITGRINAKDEEPNVVIIETISKLSQYNGPQPILTNYSEKKTKPGLYIKCSIEQRNDLLEIIKQYPGNLQVVFAIDSKAFKSSETCCPSTALQEKLEKALKNKDNIKLVV